VSKISNPLGDMSDEEFAKFRYTCQGTDLTPSEIKWMLETIFPHARETTFGNVVYKIFNIDLLRLAEFNPQYALKLTDDFENTIHEIKVALFDSSENCIRYTPRVIPYKSYEYSTHASLKQYNKGKMLRFKGQIVKVSEIYSKHIFSIYKCPDCESHIKVPFRNRNNDKITKKVCRGCTEKANENKKKGQPFVDVFMRFDSFETEDFQNVTWQESQDTLNPGEYPAALSGEIMLCRNNEDYLHNNLIGKYCDIVGTMAIDEKHNIKINNIIPVTQDKISEQDLEIVKKIIQEPDFHTKICEEIGGSIIGLDKVKEILLMLFVGLKIDNSVKGGIHILLIGDFDVGKSEIILNFLKQLKRGDFIAGTGVTEVGVLGCMEQNPVTQQWEYTAGQLLLNNDGVFGIDEKDKMPKEVSNALHTTASDGVYTISKAGKPNLKFYTNVSIVTAANPKNSEFSMGGDTPIRNQIEELASMLDRYAIIIYIPQSLWSQQEKMEKIWRKIIEKNSGNDTGKITHYGINNINNVLTYLHNLPNPIVPKEIQEYIRQECIKVEEKFKSLQNSDFRRIGLTGRNIKNITLLSRVRAKLFSKTEVTQTEVDWVLSTYSDLMWNYEYQNFGGLNRFEQVFIGGENVPKTQTQKHDALMNYLYDNKKERVTHNDILTFLEGLGIKEYEATKMIEKLLQAGIIMYDRGYDKYKLL
jgi:DNA replicative helicase MCM subunit Mcm2 (Cdc46/Mcm family)